jgi:large repetitive protein
MKTVSRFSRGFLACVSLLVFNPKAWLPELEAASPPITPMILPLTFATEASGAVSQPAQQDRFTFTGAPGQRLFFDALDLDGDQLYVRLLAPSSNAVWDTGVNTDWGPFYLTEAGTYTLLVFGYGDATGDYRFRVMDLAVAPALSLGATTGGQLDPQTEADVFRFSGTAGQWVNLERPRAPARSPSRCK